MSVMPATEDGATPVASGVSPGVGWVYLQPAPVTLVHYRHKQSIGLGAAQIVLGILCIVFNGIALGIGMYDGLGFVGHGFWCGVLFIVTGAIGISAGVSKTKCKVVSYMVLCIISAVFTIALLACGIMSSVLSGLYSNGCGNYYGYSYSYSYYYSPPCSIYTTAIAMEGCLAVCGFIAAILFIWGSVLSCKATPCCCCDTPNSFQQVLLPPSYAASNGFQGIHPAQYALPTMPYQPGMPSGYQPGLTQTIASVGAVADLNCRPNPTPIFEGSSDYPQKY